VSDTILSKRHGSLQPLKSGESAIERLSREKNEFDKMNRKKGQKSQSVFVISGLYNQQQKISKPKFDYDKSARPSKGILAVKFAKNVFSTRFTKETVTERKSSEESPKNSVQFKDDDEIFYFGDPTRVNPFLQDDESDEKIRILEETVVKLKMDLADSKSKEDWHRLKRPSFGR